MTEHQALTDDIMLFFGRRVHPPLLPAGIMKDVPRA
jgi:hypothetical protein